MVRVRCGFRVACDVRRQGCSQQRTRRAHGIARPRSMDETARAASLGPGGDCDSCRQPLSFGGREAPGSLAGRSLFLSPECQRFPDDRRTEARSSARRSEKLRHELNVTLPNEIRKAVEHGDLRENSEYKAALERQQFVQARLGQLTQRLSKLSSIDSSQIPNDKVGLGSARRGRGRADGRRGDVQPRVRRRGGVRGGAREHGARRSASRSWARGSASRAVLKLPAATRRLKIVELQTIHQTWRSTVAAASILTADAVATDQRTRVRRLAATR